MATQQASPMGLCWCGCGETTGPGSFFVLGHDGHAYSYLLQLHGGRLADLLQFLDYDPETNPLKERWEEGEKS